MVFIMSRLPRKMPPATQQNTATQLHQSYLPIVNETNPLPCPPTFIIIK